MQVDKKTLQELLKNHGIDISLVTLDRWKKKGMPYSKPGKVVYFEFEEVLKWIKEQK